MKGNEEILKEVFEKEGFHFGEGLKANELCDCKRFSHRNFVVKEDGEQVLEDLGI